MIISFNMFFNLSREEEKIAHNCIKYKYSTLHCTDIHIQTTPDVIIHIITLFMCKLFMSESRMAEVS